MYHVSYIISYLLYNIISYVLYHIISYRRNIQSLYWMPRKQRIHQDDNPNKLKNPTTTHLDLIATHSCAAKQDMPPLGGCNRWSKTVSGTLSFQSRSSSRSPVDRSATTPSSFPAFVSRWKWRAEYGESWWSWFWWCVSKGFQPGLSQDLFRGIWVPRNLACKRSCIIRVLKAHIQCMALAGSTGRKWKLGWASRIECCTMVPSHFACRYPVASPFGARSYAALKCFREMRRFRSCLRLPSLQRPSRPGGKPAHQCPPRIQQIPANCPSRARHHMKLPLPCSVHIRAPHLLPFSSSHVLVSFMCNGFCLGPNIA